MAQTIPQVLYDNTLRVGTVTYSGTVTAGFEAANAVDWRDFTLFKPQASATTTFDSGALTANTYIDTFVVWCQSFTAGVHQIDVQYESAPAVFTTIGAIILLGDGKPQWVTLTTPVTVVTGRKVRLSIIAGATALYVRQFTVGAKLSMETGQWNGVNPPTLNQGVVMENVIAINGSIIARNVRRIERKGNIELTYLTQTWVRNTWNPFSIHANRYSFWYRWNPDSYPAEVAFAAAEEIQAPQNDRPPPLMRVAMPFRCLTD